MSEMYGQKDSHCTPNCRDREMKTTTTYLYRDSISETSKRIGIGQKKTSKL